MRRLHHRFFGAVDRLSQRFDEVVDIGFGADQRIPDFLQAILDGWVGGDAGNLG